MMVCVVIFYWLSDFSFQRYGPPPSYPHLKIPGLNAPIPPGASFGYHPGGWGKPPVDEVSFSMFVFSLLIISWFKLLYIVSGAVCFVLYLTFFVLWNSLDIHYMEMFLVFSNKNSLTMRYFHIQVSLILIRLWIFEFYGYLFGSLKLVVSFMLW